MNRKKKKNGLYFVSFFIFLFLFCLLSFVFFLGCLGWFLFSSFGYYSVWGQMRVAITAVANMETIWPLGWRRKKMRLEQLQFAQIKSSFYHFKMTCVNELLDIHQLLIVSLRWMLFGFCGTYFSSSLLKKSVVMIFLVFRFEMKLSDVEVFFWN